MNNSTRLKKVQAESKKIRKAHPKLTHIEALKKAWALMPKAKATPSKTKPVAKKTVKRKTATKKKVGATMFVERGESKTKRPTKVVQVKRTAKGKFESFKTVGAITNVLPKLNSLVKEIAAEEKSILWLTERKKLMAEPIHKKMISNQIVIKKKLLSELKQHKTQLKKLL